MYVCIGYMLSENDKDYLASKNPAKTGHCPLSVLKDKLSHMFTILIRKA